LICRMRSVTRRWTLNSSLAQGHTPAFPSAKNYRLRRRVRVLTRVFGLTQRTIREIAPRIERQVPAWNRRWNVRPTLGRTTRHGRMRPKTFDASLPRRRHSSRIGQCLLAALNAGQDKAWPPVPPGGSCLKAVVLGGPAVLPVTRTLLFRDKETKQHSKISSRLNMRLRTRQHTCGANVIRGCTYYPFALRHLC
jgi:hypothetical protein